MIQYSLDQGPGEAKIIQECLKFNLPLPAPIRDAPELNLGLELYFTGFLDLSSERQTGMGLCSIPLMRIYEYCLVNGIDGDQRQDFIWFIQRIDAKYIERAQRRAGVG